MNSTPPSEILIPHDEIMGIIDRLAGAIASDYSDTPVILVGALKGATIFMSYLTVALWRAGMRHHSIDFVALSTYEGTQRVRAPKLSVDVSVDIEGKHVLIVEDIFDTGNTLQYLQEQLAGRHPASLKTVVLIEKPSRHEVDIPVEYVGKKIEDVWVQGFGFDMDELNRGCPDIFTRS